MTSWFKGFYIEGYKNSIKGKKLRKSSLGITIFFSSGVEKIGIEVTRDITSAGFFKHGNKKPGSFHNDPGFSFSLSCEKENFNQEPSLFIGA